MKKVFLLSSILLVSCTQSVSPSEENTAKEMIKISWSDVFNKEDDRYLVYFYSEECGYCASIKDEMLNYFEVTTYQMYFVDILNNEDVVIKHTGDSPVGLTSAEELFILGTPSLLEIEDKTVTNYYAGVNAIRGFISGVEEDNFSY